MIPERSPRGEPHVVAAFCLGMFSWPWCGELASKQSAAILGSWGTVDQNWGLLKGLASAEQGTREEELHRLGGSLPQVLNWGLCCVCARQDYIELTREHYCTTEHGIEMIKLEQGWGCWRSYTIRMEGQHYHLVNASSIQLWGQKGHILGLRTVP